MSRAPLSSVFFLSILVAGCGTSTTQPAAPASASSGASSDSAGNRTRITGKSDPAAAPALGKVRRFAFDYGFRVRHLKAEEGEPRDVVRIWLPCPSSSEYQEIVRADAAAPGRISENVEPRMGNRILYLESPLPASGELVVTVPYEVTRREVLPGPSPSTAIAPKTFDAASRELFLSANSLVPTTGKPLQLLEGKTLATDPMALARQLYDIVDNHVSYKKEGKGWGRGDTNWVCDSGYGNCTDFHSLFMSLARSRGIPARFEIGFSIPTDKSEGPVTGYHCWAWFHTNEAGWTPVDISEADKHPELKDYYFGGLTADRVTFSIGRDLELIPAADNQPLNFFIFPHIELAGRLVPAENIEMQCSFRELTPQ